MPAPTCTAKVTGRHVIGSDAQRECPACGGRGPKSLSMPESIARPQSSSSISDGERKMATVVNTIPAIPGTSPWKFLGFGGDERGEFATIESEVDGMTIQVQNVYEVVELDVNGEEGDEYMVDAATIINVTKAGDDGVPEQVYYNHIPAEQAEDFPNKSDADVYAGECILNADEMRETVREAIADEQMMKVILAHRLGLSHDNDEAIEYLARTEDLSELTKDHPAVISARIMFADKEV